MRSRSSRGPLLRGSGTRRALYGVMLFWTNDAGLPPRRM
jgi:hypothetical protein